VRQHGRLHAYHHTPDAIAAFAEITRNGKAPLAARVVAANVLLDPARSRPTTIGEQDQEAHEGRLAVHHSRCRIKLKRGFSQQNVRLRALVPPS
jgi:hypothetical protein